jgi:hypothetical protein
MFEKENAFFEAHFDELLKQYKGKELAISGDQILGVYDGFGEAIDETEKTHPYGTFCVKHVDEWALEPIIVYGAEAHKWEEA